MHNERGLSYPDITSISKLASILRVDSSYLIDLCRSEDNPYLKNGKIEEFKKIIKFSLKGISLAMSILVIILNLMNLLTVKDSIIMLSLGLATLSSSSYMNYQEKDNYKKN